MTQVKLNDLFATIRALPRQEKQLLLKLLSQDLHEQPTTQPAQEQKNKVQFGWAKGLITIAPDFDDPIEDFPLCQHD